jgi:hypothetical protein
MAYVKAARNLGHPPTDIEQVKSSLPAALDSDDVEKVFQSTRDGNPYVIVWGVDIIGAEKNSDTILAYERTGANGMRWVVTCRGESKEVNDTEFANLPFPKNHQPESGSR